jgi:hypothetical protein
MADKRLSSDVFPEQAFDFHSKGKINNLFELIEILRVASSEAFAHHVNPQRNDIANWIADIYQDQRLASKIRQTLDRHKIIQLVEEALAVEQERQPTRNLGETVDEIAEKRIKELTSHVKQLEDDLHHLTKQKTKTAVQKKAEHPDDIFLHASFKQGIIEFAFGLIVGIFVGMIIAKVLGLF